MPAPGDQHQQLGKTFPNPFEDVKPRISEYTAQDIAALQSRLEKQLGPEYISSRSGPSGQKVHYVAAEKCIQLANEIFGFNGWSSQIMDIQVDFVDENAQTLKVSLGLSVIVRVTLKDGTFHEDIGYGHIENCKGKAAAFEKAKKEGTTDGLKRALRNFGNVLGNCIYDKEYLGKVTKIKVQPSRWDESNLHRHSTHLPKKEVGVVKTEEKSSKGEESNTATEESLLEDEFGDFDETDFGVDDPEAHPDEVVLPATRTATSHHFQGNKRGSGPAPNAGGPPPSRPMANGRGQSMAAPPRPQNGVQDGLNAQRIPPQPLTPNSGFSRSSSGAGQNMRPPADSGPQARPSNSAQTIVNGRILNQPSRAGAAAQNAPPSPAPQSRSSDDADISAAGLPPQGAGFFSARAAAMVIPSDDTTSVPDGAAPPPLPPNLSAFNPNLESPSIRKTPGVDIKRSAPITRDYLKAAPGSSQVAAAGGLGGARPNIINPHLDATRRIGVPGAGGTSPMANRGMYKPPSMKRPVDAGGGTANGRTPLLDLPANGAIASGDGGGGDVKRQRIV